MDGRSDFTYSLYQGGKPAGRIRRSQTAGLKYVELAVFDVSQQGGGKSFYWSCY